MSKTFTVRYCGVLLALGLLAGGTADVALAGMAVSPLKQEVRVKPGEEGKFQITLRNNARNDFAGPQTARLSLADVQASEEGSLEFKEVGSGEHSASRWISLKETEIALEPGQSKTVECVVTPPLSAPPGEYYSTVMVTMGATGRNETGVVIQYRIASGIFVTVLGRTFPRQAKISRCEVIWPVMEPPAAATEGQPATRPAKPELPKVVAVVQNVGQSRFDGSGKVTLLDARSRIAFTAPLTSRRPCVFGGDSRRFEAFFSKPVPAGKYTVRVELDYQSSWAKARQEVPVEILPAEAEMLLAMKKQLRAQSPVAEVLPEKITAVIPAGATRSLALSVRNGAESEIQCVATITSDSFSELASWITIRPEDGFTVHRGGRKTVEVRIQVPEETRADRYFATLSIEGGLDGLKLRRIEVPVEIEVKTEK
jgi:hypothetical protein